MPSYNSPNYSSNDLAVFANGAASVASNAVVQTAGGAIASQLNTKQKVLGSPVGDEPRLSDADLKMKMDAGSVSEVAVADGSAAGTQGPPAASPVRVADPAGAMEETVTSTWSKKRMEVAPSNGTEFTASDGDIRARDAGRVGDRNAACCGCCHRNGCNCLWGPCSSGRCGNLYRFACYA